MTTNREQKSVKAAMMKAQDEGNFEAVIATFDQVDSDGDVIVRGAFGGAVASIMPAHDHGSVPLGKATVEERDDVAVAVGKFNLDVAPAVDWFEALKFDLDHPPAVQEWSWGYYPLKASRGDQDGESVRFLESLDITEFSPVLRGASVGTMTLSAKSASERHATETSSEVWDASPHVRRFKGEENGELYAWADAEDGSVFPHHFVDEDGKAGAASTRACITQIAMLNRGSFSLMPEAQKAIYRHLAGHLKDAGLEPPDLVSQAGVKLVDQIRIATWEVESAQLRLRDAADARKARDQHLAESTIVSAVDMAAALEEMRALSSELAELVKSCAPENEISKAIAAWEHHRARAALVE